MSLLDWLVLCTTLFSIIIYGMWKSRGSKNISNYLLADKKLPWYHVGLSVMATQASAITFLSAPAQGYNDGLRFVQFYFGLPLAMIVLCVTFIPIFQKLNVYTAYEYLEKRFDIKTRSLTAILFLIQRGLSTGVTIYAPAIILSTILEIDLVYTILFNGILVIIYTVYGGTKAVSYTQLLQMSIIFGGLILAAFLVVHLLPSNIGFINSLQIAGKLNKLNAIDYSFDLNNRYTLWSGLIGGFFLQLSYFGTDQSQVGRYLTGQSITQSRLGLVMNGMVKIPMQLFILLIGVLVFVFFQFNSAPLFFNKTELKKLENGSFKSEYNLLNKKYEKLTSLKQTDTQLLSQAIKEKKSDRIIHLSEKLNAYTIVEKELRHEVSRLVKKTDAKSDSNDSNFVFLSFVTNYLPKGIVGLLIAIIFLAAMGSTASGLNSLASTTVVDIYKRFINANADEKKYLNVSRYSTVAWGIFCIITALFASKLGNLIEAVNILGSLFYGSILGIFLVAFYFKNIQGTAVFYAAIITELIVFTCWLINLTAFLWLNVIGCFVLIVTASSIQKVLKRDSI
jgi:Na+/proline symporter